MKRILLLLPFALNLLALFGVFLARDSRALPVFGALLFGSLLACLLCVPLLSRKSLKLGYLALVLPFISLAIALLFGSTSEMTVTDQGTFRWDDANPEQARIASAVAALPVEQGSLVLYSLDPTGVSGNAVNTDQVFHGFTILGQAEMPTPKDKRALMDAFVQGIRENKGVVAACFNPRHGVRLIVGPSTCDFVICFECASVRCYGFNDDHGFLVTGSPRLRFDEFLSQLGLKKAPKRA